MLYIVELSVADVLGAMLVFETNGHLITLIVVGLAAITLFARFQALISANLCPRYPRSAETGVVEDTPLPSSS